MRRNGRKQQLHLNIRALCGEVERVLNVLVDECMVKRFIGLAKE